MTENNRVLIVDDEPSNVAILEEILEDGFTVATATNGEEALRLAADFQPDMFLLDIMMPGIDGYETCRRIRQNPDLKFAKVILVSAKAMLSERLKGYEAGADDYITKPFDHTELLAKVRVFLRLKSAEEISQLKTDFLTLVSHETRTPLTHIMGPAEILLQDDVLDAEDRRHLAQMIIDGAERIRRLFEDAIAIFSFKSGRVPFECSTFDLRALAQEVIDQRLRSGPDADITVRLRAPAELHLRGDMTSVRTILTALLNQALTGEQDSSELTVSLSGGEREVEVAIPFRCRKEDWPRLNEIFETFQVSDLDHHASHLNLDLPLIREIAEHFGGSVSIEPPGVDEGQLRVRLPNAVDTSMGQQAA
jgi:two-component system, sensor histidine kinase and response regulator